MKRVYSLLLAFLLMLSLAVPCLAVEANNAVVSPRYTHISTNYVNISINEATGVAHCSSYCYTIDDYTVEVECKLQKYAGGFYSTVKTWTSSGTSYASVHEDWAVYSGYTYMLYATFYVRDSAGNLLETATSSDSYYYPPK